MDNNIQMVEPTQPNILQSNLQSKHASVQTAERQISDPEGLRDLGLHQLVERQAAATPHATAIVHAGKTLSYQALNESANRLARYLLDKGAKAERLVGISLTRSPEMLIAFLGVLKAGAAYVPIDPDYPESRRQYILADAKVEILLTQTALLTQLAAEQERVKQVLCLDNMASELAAYSTENLSVQVAPEQLAYVIYTSGSTGNPKGVMAHHKGLVNYSLSLAEALALTAADRMLQFSTMSFDFIVSEVYPTLAVGGALVLRSDEMVTSTSKFVQFIADNNVSIIQFTTAFWHELVSGIDRLGISLPPSLRIVLFGGEKASLTLCRQWLETVGDYPRLFNAYGPTESTVITTLYDAIAEGYDGSEDLPIGRAIRNALTYVLDSDLQPVAPGESGELYIGGPGVTRGYLNQPEKTQSVFIDSPFEAGSMLYKTGDLVRMDETGLISFVGRADFQVKIRGFRIELGEIESCLDRFGTIAQRIVVVREDAPGDKRLIAYVVTKPGCPLDRTALAQFLSEQLPSFMVPSAVVELPEMPKNPNGKIDRKALPAPAADNPDDVTKRTIIAARSPLEEQLVEKWRQVLNLETVGITENFFELGGHSLLVMRLFSELEATFNQSLPLVEIFAAPTIEQMAKRLEEILDNASKQAHSSGDRQHLSKRSRINNYVTTLRKGSADSSAQPLFMMHDAVGDTGLYIHLAQKLGELQEQRSVYGIKPCAKNGVEMIHTRIPEIAQHCIEQIKSIQANGPYVISGLCAGGIIAFEAALQLEAAGEQVVLILLDSPAPTATRRSDIETTQRKAGLKQVLASKELSTAAQMLWQKSRNVIRYEMQHKIEQFDNAIRPRLFRWYQDQHQDQHQKREQAMPKWLQQLSVYDLFMFAYAEYLPQRRVKSPVLLIRATQGNGSKADAAYISLYKDPLLGWDEWTDCPLETCDVPGGHSTMLSDRHAGALAEAINSFINQHLPHN